MKHALYTAVAFSALTLFALPVLAQPVESVPLSAPAYTLQTETDPMAMDPSTAPPPKPTLHTGTAIIAPPPPGADDQPGTYYDATPAQTPSVYDTPAPLTPSESGQPPAPSLADERTMPVYPNNTVTGVVPRDESKFSAMTFCTLKVSFTSICCGPDNALAETVKAYLDQNADKLTYKTAPWGLEGEFDYCIDIPVHSNRARIYTGLKRLMPEQSEKTITILSGPGFARVETKPSR